MTDNVNHPAHYETGKFECIEVMLETQGVEAVLNFCQCNAFKYLYRAKQFWWNMIQLLPSSFNQKRTVTMTYENLLNMLEYRRGHKLDEWRMFCDWILTLPYGSLLKEGVGNEQS